jgi:hypothetical protein
MILGQQTRINTKEQGILAAWITMTVMVGDSIDETMSAISFSERTKFKQRLKTPSHWRIWIGQYRRERNRPLLFHNSLALTKNKVEGEALFTFHPSNSQTMTICLGEHLIIHVMSSPVVRSIIRRWKLPPGIAPRLRQIWPNDASIVSWPPNGVLSHGDVVTVSEQFYSRVALLQRRQAMDFMAGG